MNWSVFNYIPAWGPVRWTAIGLAVLVLSLTGVNLFRSPAYEISYSSRFVMLPGSGGKSTVICTLELGNTGRRTQDEVKVRFFKSAINHAPVKPTVKNFGISDRPVRTTTSGTETTLLLGKLDPGKRVTINLFLLYQPLEKVPDWKGVFKAVEPAWGKAKIGDPGMTEAGRGIFSTFFNYLPF